MGRGGPQTARHDADWPASCFEKREAEGIPHRCEGRRYDRALAEEDAFRRAVEAHLVVAGEDGYDAVVELLEPIAIDAPARAVHIAP